MAAEACPSIRWTALTLAPALIASEAAVCRSSCGVSPGSPMARAAGSSHTGLTDVPKRPADSGTRRSVMSWGDLDRLGGGRLGGGRGAASVGAAVATAAAVHVGACVATGSAAAFALPCLDAFPDRHGGDDEPGDRVGP